jgi:hypothetical protein
MKIILMMSVSIVIGFYLSFGTFANNSTALAQDSTNNTKNIEPSIVYTETARNLLNQVSTEYKKGNFSGAEELATRAYLDNFEYVEAPLEKIGGSEIMKQLEVMMRKDLRGMIKDEVPYEKLLSHINATDTKLDEAISILNNTK